MKTKKIPENWGSLLEIFVNSFLDGWDRKLLDKGTDIITGEAKPVLEELAYQMTRANRVDMEWSDALRIIRDEFGLDGKLLEGLVDYLVDGIIKELEENEAQFQSYSRW